MRATAVLLVCACGGSSPPAPAASSGPPASLVATSTRDDVQVATVNGRPVRFAPIRPGDLVVLRPTSVEAVWTQILDFSPTRKARSASQQEAARPHV